MGFSRYEAKMRAKLSMRGAYPHPMLVSLVFFLITSGVTLVVELLVRNPFTMFYQDFLLYVSAGYDPVEVLQYLNFSGAGGTLYIFLTILLSLYSTVVGAGYYSYSLRLARNEQPGYRNLLDGFYMVGRVILMYILQYIFVMLWSLLGMIPYTVVLILGAVLLSPGLIVLAIVLLVAGIIFGTAMSYRYRMAIYFLLDDPNMGPLASITASKNAMKGWKWSLFVLDLSFLGWLILSLFTFGILMLWLQPYMRTTEANFYDFVTHGDYSSPDFRQNLYGRPNGRNPGPGPGQPPPPGPGF